jgi:hypothetical protein
MINFDLKFMGSRVRDLHGVHPSPCGFQQFYMRIERSKEFHRGFTMYFHTCEQF